MTVGEKFTLVLPTHVVRTFVEVVRGADEVSPELRAIADEWERVLPGYGRAVDATFAILDEVQRVAY